MPAEGQALIDQADGPFKQALDRTKYHGRSADGVEQAKAMAWLDALRPYPWLFGDQPSMADFASLPFVRQFAMIDKALMLGRVVWSVTGSNDFSGLIALPPSCQSCQNGRRVIP